MPESHDQIEELLHEHCVALTHYVCPLYVVERKNGVLIGSGVPIKLGRAGVIATATHVLKAALKHDDRIWTLGGEGPFKLRHNWYGWDHRQGETVDVDVSLIPLDEAEWKELTHRYGATYPLNFGATPSDVDFLIVVGYPYSRNKPTPLTRHVVTPACTYVASNVLRRTSSDLRKGKDEDVHFGVAARPTGGRVPQGFPDPHGMSGGGVWNLRARDTLMNRGTPQLVGIGIEFDGSQFTCTRIGALGPMIRELRTS